MFLLAHEYVHVLRQGYILSLEAARPHLDDFVLLRRQRHRLHRHRPDVDPRTT
jgi:hypothetical protein